MTAHQSILARTFFLLAGALASCAGTSTPPDVGGATTLRRCRGVRQQLL